MSVMRASFVLLLISLAPLFCLGQLLEEEVLIWGIYLDMSDPEAREAAANLSDAGYTIRMDTTTDPSHLVFVPGDPGAIGKVLKRKKRDGIRVEAFSGNRDDCDTEMKKDSLIQYKYIRNNFINQFALQRYDNIPEGVRGYGPKYTKKYLGVQNNLFRKYLKGKRSNPGNMDDFGWAMLGIPMNENWSSEELSFHFIRKKETLLSIRFDTLSGRNVERFSAFQKGECRPFDRITEFRKLYGIKEYNKPSYYVPRSEQYSNRNFQLLFEKNRSDYSRESIQEIIDLIRNENLSIYRVKVEGYASVEGTLENNIKLQERRAQVLINILEQYNDEKILLDSVITTENWELFRKQIKDTKHQWLDSLSQEEIKQELEKDSLNALLEPLLATQRKAALSLTLSRKLNDDEKIEYVFNDINNLLMLHCNRTRVGFDIKGRLYGILNYLEILVERGLISAEEVRSRLPVSSLVKELLFYKVWTEQKEDIYTKVYSLEKIVRDAQALFINMYGAYNNREKYYDCLLIPRDMINRLVDVHDVTFELAREGRIPLQLLMSLSYPDTRNYYPLTLHHLYMLRQWVESGAGQSASNYGGSPIQNDPRYYFLLKKILLEGDKDILEYVYRSDHILEFDLAWFLRVNIEAWNPESDEYYDEEVNRELMMTQLNRLNRMSKQVCSRQLDQLNLDFHLKNLHYFLKNGYKEDKYKVQFARSFQYLRSYFNSNRTEINSELAVQIANQFILINNLYLSRDGTNAAYQVMLQASKEYTLEGEALELFLRLAYYHDPSFISLVKRYKPEDWCELFRGKYGMIPYGEFETEYCSSCN